MAGVVETANIGLAAVTGGAGVAEVVSAAEAAGLCAVSAFSFGLIVGGGIFFASSLFIFAFKSSCAFGSETEVEPCSIVGFWIFSFTTWARRVSAVLKNLRRGDNERVSLPS